MFGNTSCSPSIRYGSGGGDVQVGWDGHGVLDFLGKVAPSNAPACHSPPYSGNASGRSMTEHHVASLYVAY